MNRRNTATFIAANPTTIALIPQRRVRTASGGYDVIQDPARAPQVLRLIDLTTGYATISQPPQRTIDGVEHSVEFMLLGPWDSLMSRFDTWSSGGFRFEVTDLYPENGYERRAMVVRYG